MENAGAGIAPQAVTLEPGSAPALRLRAWLARTWADWRTPLLTALAAVAVLRVVTLLVAGVAAGGSGALSLALHDPGRALLAPWDQWDWAYYGSIAQHGYGHYANGIYQDLAFAPAYPAAVGALIRVVPIGVMAAGLIVSGLSLVVAAAVLFRLAAEDGGPAAGRTTLLVLLTFPTAFFLAAPYSEPLSLAAVALALYAARRQRWWWAGLAAGVATTSKYFLGVVVIALLVDHVVTRLRRGERVQISALVGITLPSAAGLVVIGAFFQARYGDAFYVFHLERSAWGHGLGSPVLLVRNAWREISSLVGLQGWAMLRAFLLDDLAILGMVGASVWMLLRHRRHVAELVTVLLMTATFVSMSGPDSASRLVLPCAPLFVLLGTSLSRRRPLGRLLPAVATASIALLQLSLFAVRGWAG